MVFTINNENTAFRTGFITKLEIDRGVMVNMINGLVVTSPEDAAGAIGITSEVIKKNREITICPPYESRGVKLAAHVNKEELLTVTNDGTGRAVKANNGDTVIGIAREEGNENDLIELWTVPPNIIAPIIPVAPEIPQNITTSNITHNNITVNWDAADNANTYRVYRAATETGIYLKVGETAGVSFTDDGLTSNTNYYYKVSSVNIYGESNTSTIATAATLPVMILTVNTAVSAGTTITLPMYNTDGNVTVDTGDGNVDTGIGDGDFNYTYAADGVYEIVITGNVGRFGKEAAIYTNADKIISVSEWNLPSLTSLSGAFRNATNLITLPEYMNTNVTDTSLMFRGANNLNTNLRNWDTSNITNMSMMFRAASNFNCDISSWDVSNVLYMDYMFYQNTVFNCDISGWDVSKVVNMNGMFWQAYVFNRDISSWNIAALTNTGSMFRGAPAFNQDLSTWDVSNITDLRNMFDGATAFNQNIGGWEFNATAQLVDMLNNSGMSSENYSKTLIGWANHASTPTGRSLGAAAMSYNPDVYGGTTYDNAYDAHNYLTTTLLWTITGDTFNLPIPNTPVNTTASVITTDTVTLVWDAVEWADTYKVYSSTTETGLYTELADIAGTTYDHTGLSFNETNWYKVSAVNTEGESALSIAIQATTHPDIPATPDGLIIIGKTNTKLAMIWNEVSSASEYNVYRSDTELGAYTEVAAMSNTMYTDTGLSPDETWWYKVSAVNITGESAVSAPIEGNTLV